MEHLTDEQLVQHYYEDSLDSGEMATHLMQCESCESRAENLRQLLATVDGMPVPERGEGYGTEVWNRLRWKLGRPAKAAPSRRWIMPLAAAALLIVAFLSGRFMGSSSTHTVNAPASTVASLTETTASVTPSRSLAPAASTATASPLVDGTTETQIERASVSLPATRPSVSHPRDGATSSGRDRVLLLVVGDHLDSSERVLLELSNADPHKPLDVSSERDRAGELVASNRLYRQTASKDGEKQIAAVLSDLEPLLVELSHSTGTMSAEEVSSLQKRIDGKGLLFKVRVIGAQVTGREENRPPHPNTSSL